MIGTEDDDVILNSENRTIAKGKGGSDLHILVRKDIDTKRNRSKILGFNSKDDGDMLLIDIKTFGRNVGYERALTNLQKRKFQKSEADFVYLVPKQVGGEPTKLGKLFDNANGSESGWGAEGGLSLILGKDNSLPLDALAMI